MADASLIIANETNSASQPASRGRSRIPIFNNSIQVNKSVSDDNDQNENFPNYTDKWKFQLMTINKQLKNLNNKKLFTDPYFDVNDEKNCLIKDEVIKWMRPRDLIEQPVLGINSTNFKDVIQGQLDDCAFIAACDVLSKYPFLLKNIFQKDIDLYGPNHDGCIRVRFWINEEWVWICIDDRVPLVNGALCYGRCLKPQNFWVPLIEKAYAKYYGSYQNLIGLDSATVLINLTGGVALKLNPTLINDREAIFHYLNRAQEKHVTLAIAGSELLLNNEKKTGAQLMKTKNKKDKNKNNEQLNGHAYSLIDVIYLPKTKTHYIKLRNSQISMTIYKEIVDQEDLKVLENILTLESGELTNLKEHSDILCFSYDEFFEYFEVFTIIVILNDYLPGFDACTSGYWSIDCGLKFGDPAEEEKIIEKYLKSPHFYFNVINRKAALTKNSSKEEKAPINFIVNLLTDNLELDDFIGIVILPIRERAKLHHNQKEVVYFVNYTIYRQKLCNTNPLCLETKLLPGKYMIGLIVQSQRLPKRFSLRIATNTPDASIMRLQELIKQPNDQFLLTPTNSPNSHKRLIRVILSRCCACQCILDQTFICAGPKVFCHTCYNLSFRCDICNVELGQVYYTLEEKMCCESCLEGYTKTINLFENVTEPLGK